MALVEDWAEISEAWDVEGFAPEPVAEGLRLESGSFAKQAQFVYRTQ